MPCRVWSKDPAYQKKFPVFISIDGDHRHALDFAYLMSASAGVQVIQNLRAPGACSNGPLLGYCRLSMHYKMILQLFFECLDSPRLIFLEEDLEVAPDFFTYFEATAPLLEADETLWCASAWNDHGQKGRALDNKALYRTDIMPGLGWMLNARVGRELFPIWPQKYWDDWMRLSSIRNGRQCIFPEVPRTHTFGAVGTSKGKFYHDLLEPMILNKEPVDWLRMVSK